ncbi:MAG TPA: RNA-directed DNA polymerase [Candidatus Cybelea sp.]|nr:RNA-directed DNA polymerase [Candidatus Cybelea sp.]
MKEGFSLKQSFSEQRLKDVWGDHVWRGLRKQGCQDLIEYYDYNVTVDENIRKLSAKIVNGTYRTSRPLILELNKADKLVRRIQVPTPEDALTFQAIAEAVLPAAKAHSPSSKAYFSRSHNAPKGIHTMNAGLLYPWFKLWPKYQTDILDFAKDHKYLVITDIQNFFDSVPHSAIDRSLSLIGIPQGLRDITLYMLEGFVPRDLYGPLVLRGLPQLDFDAPRLLAHILLFPIDRFIEKKSRGAFARWVDDINFGVDTRSAARDIVRSTERFLARIELRLNGPKTQILSRVEAEEYLCVSENLKLTQYHNELKSGRATVALIEKLYEDFLYFLGKGAQRGHWDQVYRRYINLVTSTLKAFPRARALATLRRAINVEQRNGFERHVDYRNRETIIRYWEASTINKEMVNYLLGEFYEVAKTDDVIAFGLARLLVNANLPLTSVTLIRKRLGRTNPRVGGMLGVTMLLCKYGEPAKIEKFIRSTLAQWSGNEFLARQVISLWSVLSPASPESNRLRALISRNVSTAGNDLIIYYEELRETRALPKGLEGYTSPAKMKRPYTLAKAIVTSNLFRSGSLPTLTRARIVSAFGKVEDERLKGIALNSIYP